MKFLMTALALGLISVPKQASAWLHICNQSGAGVHMVVGYKHDGRWISRGWWFAENGGCATPVEGALQQRYYYVHFQSQAKGVSFDNPNTNYGFCVLQKPFVIHGAESCTARGYEWRDFNRIDTGDALDYTLTIR